MHQIIQFWGQRELKLVIFAEDWQLSKARGNRTKWRMSVLMTRVLGTYLLLTCVEGREHRAAYPRQPVNDTVKTASEMRIYMRRNGANRNWFVLMESWTANGPTVLQCRTANCSVIILLQLIIKLPVKFYLPTNWMIGGSSSGRGWEFFSSPPRPDRQWVPHSLLSSGYHGLFLWG